MASPAEYCAMFATRRNIVQAADCLASWHDRNFGQTAIAHVSDLIRDIFGNPFRPAALAPACLAWNNGAVGKLAQSIYDKRSFANLPALGDTLAKAGCADQQILEHCRAAGPHVRGCWVLDLILGKGTPPRTFALDRCTRLVPAHEASKLSAGEVCEKLRAAFKHVAVSTEIGAFRLEHRLRELIQEGASQAVLDNERGMKEPAVQVAIYERATSTPTLDMSVTPSFVSIYHDPSAKPLVRRCAEILGYDRSSCEQRAPGDETLSPEEAACEPGVIDLSIRQEMERLLAGLGGATVEQPIHLRQAFEAFTPKVQRALVPVLTAYLNDPVAGVRANAA